MINDSRVVWRKSSFSGDGGTGGGDCVEAAALEGGRFGLRDSKNPDAGALTLPGAGMAALLAEITNR
ncbi:MAG: DUF397 domain-containing protein [Actinomycetota bacterium]|nr:DUF397 domain-containing protein [Actinomycetota bacterium]